jgi:hypothetical protein
MFCHAGNDPANPRALRLGVFQDVNAIRQQIPFRNMDAGILGMDWRSGAKVRFAGRPAISLSASCSSGRA